MLTASPDRQTLIDQAREGWIRRLYDLTRRNNLLYFRALKTGTLDLSAADPAALTALLAGRAVPLSHLASTVELDRAAASVQEIRRRALANLEEKGLNTLYLALGMASWTPTDEGRPPESAVVLLPVTVEAQGRDARAVLLQRAGDEQANLVLLHALESQFGVSLTPEALLGEEDPLEPAAIYQRLTAAAQRVPGFTVSPRAILGNFAFQKMAMVHDLRARGAEMAGHQLIAALAGDAEARAAIRQVRDDLDPRELDHIPAGQEFLVSDADSSQQRVVVLALSGQNGVIQGPPGTGKSQTITNLIASYAAQGQRVLFVAEKRAALEVVLRRLQQAGLGHLALDLHGVDLSRREIMRGLADRLRAVRESQPVDGDEMHTRLEDRRRRLNNHVARLHEPRDPSGLSAYALQGHILALPAEVASTVRWRGAELQGLTAEAATRARDLLLEAGGFEAIFLRRDPSPWAEADLRDGAAVEQAVDLARRLAQGLFPPLRAQLVPTLEGCGLGTPASLRDGIALLALATGVTALLTNYAENVFALELDTLARELLPAQHGAFTRFFAWLTNTSYRAALKTLQGVRLQPAAPGVLLDEVRQAAEWAKRWRERTHGAPVQRAVGLAEAEGALAAFRADFDALQAYFPNHNAAGLTLDELERWLQALAADNVTPQRLPRLRAIEAELDRLGLAPFVAELRRLQVPTSQWPTRFDAAWLASCLDEARAKDAELGGFNGRTHDQFVTEFCDLDQQRLPMAAARVRRRHAEHAIAAMNRFPEQEDLVRREAEKKTRHLPLRKLLAQAPDVLTALCPCWMASPLSVSHLLDADRRYFDVVIFDEASQVLPEDAVPALLRASQAVVAGDKHQLPPTTFFSTLGDDEGEAEEAAPTEGFESLLELMAAFLDPWTLEWHYRSRDEALIAFSNHHIYGDRLVTFPGAGGAPVVTHELVAQAAGDGQGDSSAAEVQRVVTLVLDHARSRPAETLGVIALGIPHARRIEEALDAALDAQPELEPFFEQTRDERFFVKNLERVQGDERDAIILSVGYGKDANGKLPYRFGPLLTEGGERRLNVAITRARRRMTLVSSFSHRDMDPARSSARGVELLRGYLQYAAEGGTPVRIEQGQCTLADFEADVYGALTAAGIPLQPQWGASRYRIDFAAHHPACPECLLLAIECDGVGYSQVPTARDRDRLRRQQLQRLGWAYHRIWSTDWFLRRDEEIARAVAAYRQACEAPASVPATPTPVAAQPEAVSARPARPRLPHYDDITDFTEDELLRLIDWVNSDGRLRTDEELLEELTAELGYKRRGPRIEARLRDCIARWRQQ